MPGNTLLKAPGALDGLGLLAADGADEEVPRERIEAAIEELKRLSERPECMARLHDIERLIVSDVLKENRHLKCTGCLRWITALIMKAQGKEWR